MNRHLKISRPGYFNLNDLRELVKLAQQWPGDTDVRIKSTHVEDSITLIVVDEQES